MQSVGFHGGYLSPTGNIWDEGDRLEKTLSSLERLELQYGGPPTSLRSLPWTNLWEGECSIFYKLFTLLFGAGCCSFIILFFVDATLDLMNRVDVNSWLVSSKATCITIYHAATSSTKSEDRSFTSLYFINALDFSSMRRDTLRGTYQSLSRWCSQRKARCWAGWPPSDASPSCTLLHWWTGRSIHTSLRPQSHTQTLFLCSLERCRRSDS